MPAPAFLALCTARGSCCSRALRPLRHLGVFCGDCARLRNLSLRLSVHWPLVTLSCISRTAVESLT